MCPEHQVNRYMTTVQDYRGLTITVQTPPRKPDPFDMLLFFLGVGMTLLGGSIIVFHNNWNGLLPLFAGLGLAIMMYILRTMRMRGAVDRYLVSIQGDDLLFSHNESPPQSLSRSKLGRLWITHRTTNGVTTGYDLSAYHDGMERHIFHISNVVETLGTGDELLELIVNYLNSPPDEDLQANPESGTDKTGDAADQQSDGTAGNAAVPRERVLSGYRSDYATNTPQAARDVRTLKSFWVRLCYSLGLALLLLVLCFLPYHPSISWILPFYNDDVWNIVLILATLLIIGPMTFSIVLSFCGACSCRDQDLMKDLRGWIFCSLVAAWLLQSVINYLIKQFDLIILDIIVVIAMLFIMTWIFFRVISGCSCGSHPERGNAGSVARF